MIASRVKGEYLLVPDDPVRFYPAELRFPLGEPPLDSRVPHLRRIAIGFGPAPQEGAFRSVPDHRTARDAVTGVYLEARNVTGELMVAWRPVSRASAVAS